MPVYADLSGASKYANLSGKSNVDTYRELKEGIEVTFNDGSVYTYTHASAGKSNVNLMKRLANQGHGLNGFINVVVRKLYESKA